MVTGDQYDFGELLTLLGKADDPFVSRDSLMKLKDFTEYQYMENFGRYFRNYYEHQITDPLQADFPGIKNFRFAPSCLTHHMSH